MPKQRPSRTVVIDLGSNSFRLVAYDYVPERWWRRSDEIYDGVRIGAGMLANGALSEERMEGALEVLDVYAHFCLAAGMPLSDVTAVATSAIRDATNGAEFVERVRQRTKLAVRIVSAHEEAYYAYLAAVNSTTLTDGAVLDLGGGSLQLVHVESRRALETSSWPLGTVRMTERFFPDKRASAKQLNALREHVLEELRKARWLERLEGMIVGMGGTARNLASAPEAREQIALADRIVLTKTALADPTDLLEPGLGALDRLLGVLVGGGRGQDEDVGPPRGGEELGVELAPGPPFVTAHQGQGSALATHGCHPRSSRSDRS